ncbi:hypothetical protein O3W44_04215 [Pantoea sp. LMR881]|nr:hypothetical protein [Pantoea sp. LMR881]MCZ4058458.1 hypothetical protein [Pantoea sp. LMR881]
MKTPGSAGCFFTGVAEMVRRYRFEIILIVMILCGIVAACFFI